MDKNKEILFSLLINVLAVIAIMIMVSIELFYLIRGHRKFKAAEKTDGKIPVEIFRFIVFLIFFFTNLTSAILPIYSLKLSEGSGVTEYISPIMLSALPISSEVFSGAIFSLMGGSILNKLGARRSIMISSALFTLGLVLRAIPNIFVLIFSALLLGAGWGVLLILVNILLADLPDEEKVRGYAYYSISALSGINSAVVLGGFMIQWMNYPTLFIITGIWSISLFIACRYYLNQEIPFSSRAEKGKNLITDTLVFLRNPGVLIFFIFIMIPLLISGYFMTYLFPILGSDWGMSESHIGYSYLLSGAVVLTVTSKLSSYLSARKMKHVGLAVSAFLYAAAFLTVAFFQNIPVLLASILLLGLAESFSTLLPAYFTDLRAAEKYGYDRAWGLYSLIENVAQSLGSFVFGYVLILGLKRGLMLVLTVLTVFGAIFLIGSVIIIKNERIKEEKV
ncbi:MFS transporter [Lachnospiraceae bacterium C1.1]|nr:MFS transporter [Lachnospiraceae bacterium C1.1]